MSSPFPFLNITLFHVSVYSSKGGLAPPLEIYIYYNIQNFYGKPSPESKTEQLGVLN